MFSFKRNQKHCFKGDFPSDKCNTTSWYFLVICLSLAGAIKSSECDLFVSPLSQIFFCGQPTSPGGYQSHRCNCSAL